MAIASRLDAYQRAHPRLGFPIAVLYKYFDDQGGYLAALITYYGFVSLFPLLLLLSTVLGLVLAGNPAAQQHVLHSALADFPVVGQQLQDPRHLGGGPAGVVLGFLGALYGGLGVAQAVQNAMDVAWLVPRDRRPGFLRARLRSLGLLATIGLAVAATSVLTAVGNGAGGLGVLVRILVWVASTALDCGVFVVAFKVATARPLSLRQVLPGALAAAVVWQLLQTFGATYVGHVVRHASATNGVFALVLGLIAFVYLAATSVVLCVEVNVVRVDRLYPRSLLRSGSALTAGDERAYAREAAAQQVSRSEDVSVRFDS